jgi:hypothetical protein
MRLYVLDTSLEVVRKLKAVFPDLLEAADVCAVDVVVLVVPSWVTHLQLVRPRS